jgi:hypothetical protein
MIQQQFAAAMEEPHLCAGFLRRHHLRWRFGEERALGCGLPRALAVARNATPLGLVRSRVEWLSFHSNTLTDVEARGNDLDLETGSDIRVSCSWTVGPYASARTGTYKHLSLHPHWRGDRPSKVDLSG